MSVDEALLILQRHERARQGRLRAKLMEDIRRQEATAAAEKGKQTTAAQSLSTVVAANRIQKMWRGALARREVRKLREEELTFIGMVRTTSRNLHRITIKKVLISCVVRLPALHFPAGGRAKQAEGGAAISNTPFIAASNTAFCSSQDRAGGISAPLSRPPPGDRGRSARRPDAVRGRLRGGARDRQGGDAGVRGRRDRRGDAE